MTKKRVVLTMCLVCFFAVSLWAQSEAPHYCKTEVGVLGPYPNPGNVHVGDPCFGTKNGQRYEGEAVMGKDNDEPKDGMGKDNDGPKDGLPHYCKTEVGVLGPYPNPGNVHVGDPCFGTKNGRRYEGEAVMGKNTGN